MLNFTITIVRGKRNRLAPSPNGQALSTKVLLDFSVVVVVYQLLFIGLLSIYY